MLSVLLKKAVEWEVIERMPCTVKLLRVDKGTAAFHDFDEYERLVEVARSIDARTLLMVLLGGEAGLRCGEMIGARMGRRRSREAAAVRASVGLERAGRRRRRADGCGTCRSRDGWPRRSSSIGTCGANACCARTTASRSRGRSCRTG